MSSDKEKAILTIVEELKDVHVEKFLSKIYNAEFWYPLIPMKEKKVEVLESEKKFGFQTRDVIVLDALGTLKQDLDAKGTILIKQYEVQSNQTHFWDLEVNVENLQALIGVRVKAKNISSGMKLGIYIYKIQYDWGLLQGFGEDAVLFAARMKIRESIELFQNVMKRM